MLVTKMNSSIIVINSSSTRFIAINDTESRTLKNPSLETRDFSRKAIVTLMLFFSHVFWYVKKKFRYVTKVQTPPHSPTRNKP